MIAGLFVCMCGGALAADVQHTEAPRPDAGMVMAQMTLSPGWSTRTGELRAYVVGDVEIYTSAHHALRGDVAIFVGDQQGDGPLLDNHTVFVGHVWHPLSARVDPYVGWQPGLALTRTASKGAPHAAVLTPVISEIAGVNVYFHPLLNFFVEGRHVIGRHLGDQGGPVGLGEVRVSMGLDWVLRRSNRARRGGVTKRAGTSKRAI